MARKKKFLNESNDNNTSNIATNHPEVLGVILIVTSLLIFLGLFSFTQGSPNSNWLGLVGYGVAWTLLYTFGILCYPLNMLLVWIGWKKLCHKPIEQVAHKIVHLSIMTFSLCILLNSLAEFSPSIASLMSESVYSEKIFLQTPLNYKQTRHYLGGFFCYYLYADLPSFNLLQLLGSVGVNMVFSMTFLVSLLLVTQFRPSTAIEWFNKTFLAPPKEIPLEDPSRKGAQQKSILTYLMPLQKFYKKIKGYFIKGEAIPTLQQEKTFAPSLFNLLEPQLDPKVQKYEPEVHIPFGAANHKEIPLANSSLKDSPIPNRSITDSITKKERAIAEQRVYNGDFKDYKLPSPKLLTNPKRTHQPTLKEDLRKLANVLEDTLLSFGIEAKVGEIHCGPTIVSFEVHPATGVKVQKIKALENDIALNMQSKSIRIIAPIPGKAVVGIEIPAPEPQEVSFKEVLEEYQKSSRHFNIPVLLGQTVTGEHVMTDLVRMPHCIIAGATGTGKSVCINSIVMSLLMNCKPDEVKLILVDPKKVELSPYTKLPHMLAPVITEPAETISALKWLVREMEHRYEVLKLLGFRNIASFNSRQIDKTFESSLDIEIPGKMYYIVCIIDELADLMMLSSNEIEVPIARIAQMARAVGIHLILATQRPSREVITGLIKANFPTRISFKVASRVNSQIVLDEIGAESLLGSGDMLFMPPGAATLIRNQGCFIYDQDVHKIVDEICRQAPPNYLIDSFDQIDENEMSAELMGNLPSRSSSANSNLDSLYDQAVDLVMKTGVISTTFLQRKLKIGYARAASIVDQLEEQGLISAQDGSKPRKLLAMPKKDDSEFNLSDADPL